MKSPMVTIADYIEADDKGYYSELFAGVGTTAVAAKAFGAHCTLIEREERYCAATVERLAQTCLPFAPIAEKPVEARLFEEE
jgi:DNA modification methylase